MRLKASPTKAKRGCRQRTGAATLDYALVLGIILPLAVFMMKVAPRIMLLVYQMTAVLLSWPFN